VQLQQVLGGEGDREAVQQPLVGAPGLGGGDTAREG
jgi:hypothetical protein